MSKTLCAILARISVVFGSAVLVLAGAPAGAFPVHSSPSAQTLEPMKVAFQPYPGANPLRDYSFLLNSLSVGLFDGFEIGTVPLMWQKNEMAEVSNFNMKYRLARLEEWTIAIGWQRIFYEIKSPEMIDYFSSLDVTQIGLGVDYRPLGSDFEFRYNVATSQMLIRDYLIARYGNTSARMTMPMAGGVDHYLDIQMKVAGGNAWVFGLTRNHDVLSGLADPNSHAAYGAGVSYGWRFRDTWLSGLSLGLHYREGTGVKTLGSVTF